MSEKIRNSIRSPEAIYDIVITSTEFMATYANSGEFVNFNDIDPDFKLDWVCGYQDTSYWNYETRSFDAKNGEFIGIPVNGNVQVLYYRRDLYEEKGLQPPKTWDDLIKNAAEFHNPPRMYGMTKDRKGAVTYNFGPYMFSHGGAVYKDPQNGDFSIVFNSENNKKALEKYLEIRDKVGHPNAHSIGQGEMIQYLRTGKAAHAIAVIAAWGGMDDEEKSAVIGKMGAALIPSGLMGAQATWTLGGTHSKEREADHQKAALKFLKWLVTKENPIKYTENGAVPVRCDLIYSPIAKEDRFRFIEALGQNSEVAKFIAPAVTAVESTAITNLYLNKIVAGEISIVDGLNQAAEELHKITADNGMKTGMLPSFNRKLYEGGLSAL